jgi:SAM-dependent MidA family methyltransferase
MQSAEPNRQMYHICPSLIHLQDYIAEKEPVTYSCMSYTTIEISTSLAALQQQHIVQQRGHAQAWRCVRGDAAQPQAWGDVAAALPQQHSMQQHAFVLMMEVLDNLPHDRWALFLTL